MLTWVKSKLRVELRNALTRESADIYGANNDPEDPMNFEDDNT